MYIGENIARVDAYDKAIGKAQYPDDIEFDNMLYAGVVRSAIPYGKVLDVNYEEISKMDGIVKIIDYTMIPGEITHGVVLKDQPVLVKNIVRRIGDPILLIVAENKKILKEAISKVKIRYEEFKGIFSIDDALVIKQDTPILGEQDNILYKLKIKKGDTDRGFKEAKFIAENWYTTPAIEHSFMQPECAVGRINEKGKIEIFVATQYAHYDKEELCRALALSEDKIEVINTAVGGAFGAREDITLQIHTGLAVYYTKKPVKIVYTREESTTTHCKRHAFKMYYKTGVMKDGKLCALKARIYGDTGAYCSWGMNVLRKAAVHATGPYIIPNVDIESMAVYTNNSFSGAMRGFGALQVTFAYESQMDILCKKLNMHPLTFRYINSFSLGSITATNQCLESSVGIKKCIEKISEKENVNLL